MGRLMPRETILFAHQITCRAIVKRARNKNLSLKKKKISGSVLIVLWDSGITVHMRRIPDHVVLPHDFIIYCFRFYILKPKLIDLPHRGRLHK